MSVTTITILPSHLHRNLQSGHFLIGFLTKSLYCGETLSPTCVHTYPDPLKLHCPSNIWWSIQVTMFPIIKYLKFLTHLITFWPTLFSRHVLCPYKNHCCMSRSPSYWLKGRPVQSLIAHHKKSEVVTKKHIFYPDGTDNSTGESKVLCLIILT
jgi:hypothetical protein